MFIWSYNFLHYKKKTLGVYWLFSLFSIWDDHLHNTKHRKEGKQNYWNLFLSHEIWSCALPLADLWPDGVIRETGTRLYYLFSWPSCCHGRLTGSSLRRNLRVFRHFSHSGFPETFSYLALIFYLTNRRVKTLKYLQKKI